MELSKWNVREFKIESGDGEYAYILYRPITQGWRTRHLEITLKIQKAFAELVRSRDALKGADDVSDDEIQSVVLAQQETQDLLEGFQKGMLSDLIVGCRELTIHGKEPSREVLIETVLMMEDIVNDLCNHIADQGTLGEEEGKS